MHSGSNSILEVRFFLGHPYSLISIKCRKRDLVVVSFLRVVRKKMSLLKNANEFVNLILCSKDFLI